MHNTIMYRYKLHWSVFVTQTEDVREKNTFNLICFHEPPAQKEKKNMGQPWL